LRQIKPLKLIIKLYKGGIGVRFWEKPIKFMFYDPFDTSALLSAGFAQDKFSIYDMIYFSVLSVPSVALIIDD